MSDIRNAILQQMSSLGLTIYQVSKMVKDHIPMRTVYAFLSGVKDTGTETASILMEALGLKVEVDADRTKYLRAKRMKQSKSKTFLGRFKNEWEKAGKPNWSLREQIGICLLIDLEFSIEGRNPAPKFRDAVERKDLKYLKTWVQGLKFDTWNKWHCPFANETMRDLFFEDPKGVINKLTDNSWKEYLLEIWDKAGKNLEKFCFGAPNVISREIRKLNDNTEIALITLPKHRCKPEVYFIALALPSSEKYFSSEQKVIPRYLLLEKSVARGYSHLDTALKEWTEEGVNKNIGYGCEPTLEAFYEAVCNLLMNPQEILNKTREYISDHAGSDRDKWSNWDDALKAVDNKAIIEFFKRELDAGRENYLRKRTLYYRFAGRRRFFVSALKKTAYVWQYRRFPDDETYWSKKIGEHIGIKPVREGKALRFFLSQAKDFEQFINAINGDLQKVEFTDEPFEYNGDDK